MTVEFGDPPPRSQGKKRSTQWDDSCRQVMERPGDWGKIAEGDYERTSEVSKLRGTFKHLGGHWDMITRKNRETGEIGIWVKYSV